MSETDKLIKQYNKLVDQLYDAAQLAGYYDRTAPPDEMDELRAIKFSHAADETAKALKDNYRMLLEALDSKRKKKNKGDKK